jgi:hypothetical protein
VCVCMCGVSDISERRETGNGDQVQSTKHGRKKDQI